MDKIAVTVMPVADVKAWKQFCEEISTGKRSDAHRAFLRRANVTAEHIFHQPTPMGDLMVLAWEGVTSDEQAAHFASVLQDPKTDHEKYLRDHVIPTVHGIDTSAPPPDISHEIACITT